MRNRKDFFCQKFTRLKELASKVNEFRPYFESIIFKSGDIQKTLLITQGRPLFLKRVVASENISSNPLSVKITYNKNNVEQTLFTSLKSVFGLVKNKPEMKAGLTLGAERECVTIEGGGVLSFKLDRALIENEELKINVFGYRFKEVKNA